MRAKALAATVFLLAAGSAVGAPYAFTRRQTLTGTDGVPGTRVQLGKWFGTSAGPDLWAGKTGSGSSIVIFKNLGGPIPFEAVASSPSAVTNAFSFAVGLTGNDVGNLDVFYGRNPTFSPQITFHYGPSGSGLPPSTRNEGTRTFLDSVFAPVLGSLPYQVVVSRESATTMLLFSQATTPGVGPTFINKSMGSISVRAFSPAMLRASGTSSDFVVLPSPAPDTRVAAVLALPTNDTETLVTGAGFGYQPTILVDFAPANVLGAIGWDLDGGLADLVAVLDNGTLAVSHHAPEGTFAAPLAIAGASTAGADGIVALDLDPAPGGDGQIDAALLLVRNAIPPRVDLLVKSGATAVVASSFPAPAGDPKPREAAVADVDGDGRRDLVISWSNDAQTAFAVTYEQSASPPSAGLVNDGAGSDVDWQSSTTTIDANWTPFVDATHGITGYEWAIGTTSGGTEVQAFTGVGLANGASSSSLALVNGQTYYVTVRATNGVGLTATANSDGVTVDSSGPVPGTVSDGPGPDISFQASTSTIDANWTAFTDPQSGITNLEWAIGTTSGGSQVQNFTTAGITGNSATRGGLSLASGQSYFVTVRATSGAGVTIEASSDGVTVDTSAPTAGTVADGGGGDIDWQSSTTTIQANWSGFVDPDSGITGYQWAIGTTSGGADVQGFTSVGLATSASNGSLTLADGQIYFVTVRAINATGFTVDASSDGVTVDTSPPNPGTVADGAGIDIDFQGSTTTIAANWSGFIDAQSGITGYEWAIGTTFGGTEVQGFVAVGLTTSASNGALALADLATYYVTVRATSATGAQITASSDGVTVDTSGPTAGTVADGSFAPDIDFQASTTTIEANWSGFADLQSGITGYEWAIGTSVGGTDVQGFTSVGAATSASNGSLVLLDGQAYYVRVRATNGAGGTVVADSDGVLVDTSGPTAGTVADGLGLDLDWQSSTSSLSANWTGFADAQSGITGYEWAIGTSSGGTQIQVFTPVGLALNATASSLSLGNGQIYFVTVRATSATGATVLASSDGVTVDTSGPSAGTVADGPGTDVDWQASTTAIGANWTGFADGQSGITGYEWAIGTTSGGTDVQGFVAVGLATSAANGSLSLSNGQGYFVTVRATSGTGATVLANSDGVTVDTTGPAPGTVSDGAGADLDWQASTTSISANWSGFGDVQSGITGYEWAIGTTSGGVDVQGFVSVGLAVGASNGSLSLSDGQIYFVTVRATSGTGATVLASSDGVTVDTSGPTAGTVRDGLAADVDWQASATSISANWSGFADLQSGITGYEWAIGTTSGGTDIQGFVGVGPALNATNGSLSLSGSQSYFVTVRATSATGAQITATSDGVTVDTTGPNPGTVDDGPGADIDFQGSTNTIGANWSGFVDPQSGIAGYEWAIGTTSGGTDIQGFVSVGLLASASNGALTLASGQIYFVTVRATSGTGATTLASSDGVTVDTSAPVAGSVNDGPGPDVDLQASTTTIGANWLGFTDGQSGITGYAWAIGTTSGGTDVQGFVAVGLAGSASNGALALTDGQIYFVTVRATNGAGDTVMASSDGVTVDATGPTAGTVRDGLASDVDWQFSTTTVNANWSGFADPQSGITGYEWAIGTTVGGTQVQGFTAVGLALSAGSGSLALGDGQTYFVTVRATSGTGASVQQSSDGITVDTSGPTAGPVSDGAGVDIDFQVSTSSIGANWTGFADAQSGITGYEWAIGTTPGGTDVQGFVAVGLATSASNGALALAGGQIYFVTVRATSGAGATVQANSDGVTVDTTGPTAGTVADGPGADLDWQASTTTLSANWSGFADPESAITGYEWAIGTTSGGTQVQGFVGVGLAGSASNGALTLTDGQIYFVTVRATNGAGGTVLANSDGVTVDATGPTPGSVRDGAGADLDWQASTTALSANWSGFADLQSGITGYQWAIGTSPGGTQVQGFTSVALATSASNTSLALTSGQIYFVTVLATSGTGATVQAISDGVTVDASPPTAGTVADGLGPDLDWQASTTTISANWTGFDDPQSGITGYEWAIGTTAGGTQVQGFVGVGLAANATNNALSLTHGQGYFVTVRATSATGATAEASSDGVTVDTTGPAPGTVSDGSGAPSLDVDWQASTTTISANWVGFGDAQSGITGYEWAIGTTSGGTQIQGFTGVGLAVGASNGSLTLVNGQSYFVTVRATSGTGATVLANSDGVTVDTSGPTAGTVGDGAGADIDFQLSTTTLQANWTGFGDPQSGITGYEWAIGTTPGGTQVQGFTPVGAATNASNGALTLAQGQAYFVSVRATSGTGATVLANSDGVTVDTTVPVAGTVNDGPGADIDFQLSTTTIQANWSGFADPESGITGYQWAIGTSAGGTQVQGFTPVALATSASNGSLSLANGQTYFVTVRASNAVGLTAEASSDGVATPSAPTVVITNPAPAAVIPDHSLLTVDATATDPDPTSVIWSWELYVGGVLRDSASGPSPVTLTWSVPGYCSADLAPTPTIEVRATDETSLTGSAQRPITIDPQSDVPTLTNSGNANVNEQDAWGGWTGRAIAPDCADVDRVIDYLVTVDGVPQSTSVTTRSDATGTAVTLGQTIAAENVCINPLNHAVTVQADIHGSAAGTAQGSAAFTVAHVEAQNGAPFNVGADPGMATTVEEGQSLTLDGEGQDECPGAAISWDAPFWGNGLPDLHTQAAPSWCQARGGWDLTVKVTDSQSAVTPATVPVLVTISPAAQVSITSVGAAPASINEGGSTTVSVVANPYCIGDPLSYTWTVPAGVADPGSVNSFPFSAPTGICNGGNPTTFNFSVVASESGVPPSPSQGTAVSVADVNGAAPSLAVNGGSVAEGAVVALGVAAPQVQDDCAGWSWIWVAGPVTGGGSSASPQQAAGGVIDLSGQPVLCANGTANASLQVTDSHPGGGNVTLPVVFTVLDDPANNVPAIASATVTPAVIHEKDPMDFDVSHSGCPGGPTTYLWGGDLLTAPASTTAGSTQVDAGCGPRPLPTYTVQAQNANGSSAVMAVVGGPSAVLPAPGAPQLAPPAVVAVNENTTGEIAIAALPALGAATSCGHAIDVQLLPHGGAPAPVRIAADRFSVAAPSVCAARTFQYDVVATDLVNGEVTTGVATLDVVEQGNGASAAIAGAGRVPLDGRASTTEVRLSAGATADCPTSAFAYQWQLAGLPPSVSVSGLDQPELVLTIPDSAYGEAVAAQATVSVSATTAEGAVAGDSQALGFDLGDAVLVRHALDRSALAAGEVATLRTVLSPTVHSSFTEVLVCKDFRGFEPAGSPVVHGGRGQVVQGRCPAGAGATWGLLLERLADGVPVRVELPVRLALAAAAGVSTAQAFDGRSGAALSPPVVARLGGDRLVGCGCQGESGGGFALLALILVRFRRWASRFTTSPSSAPT
jgi:hypothetical protein